MKARLIGCEAPEWAAILVGVRHDIYHLPTYAKLSAAHEGGDAVALYVEDGPRRLLLPLVAREIRAGNGRDATSPYGYPGPLVLGTDDPAFVSGALAAGVEALRLAGLVTLFVRLHPLLNPEAPTGLGEVVLHGTTVSIDLTIPFDKRWEQMRLNHRRDIRKALEHGYVARIDPDFARFDGFRDVYRATMARRSAAQYYLFDDSYFDQLRTSLSEWIRLLVVEKDGMVAAAGLFTEADGLVEYHLGGTAQSSQTAEPSKLLLHAAANWAAERGSRSLHLGGGVGGAEDSLLYFKAGYSPLRHPYRTMRVVLDEEEYRRLVAARDPELDPTDLGGYFPAYRAS